MSHGRAWLALAIAVLLGATWFAWTGSPDTSTGTVQPAPAAGENLFRSKGCATCHDGPRSASLTDAGPSLAAARSWAGERRHGVSAAAYLRESILDPGAFVSPAFVATGPLSGMPLLAVGEAEADALVAYLLAT